jgi:hypothetical protein
MGLLDELIFSLSHGDEKVKDVRVGVTWIGVLSRNLGLAKTYPASHGFKVKDVGRLIGKSALELAEYSKSWNLMEAGIGVAALNSLIEPKGDKINVLDFIIEQGRGKKVAMVGHFPRVEEIRKAASELWVLEKNPKPLDFPDTAADYLIPQADIVAITGSALINKSLEHLLELSQGYTIVFGPSAPMSEVLLHRGVDMIGGTKVVNVESALLKISQGGNGVPQFKEEFEFLVMKR